MELNVFRAGFSGESLTSIKQGVFTQPNNCQPVLNQLFVCFLEVWSIRYLLDTRLDMYVLKGLARLGCFSTCF